MLVVSWLRQLDDDALTGRLTARFAHPDCTPWQAWWGLAGAVCGLAVGLWWLVAVTPFAAGSLLVALAIGLPWPALPLLLMLRAGRPAPRGGAAALLALAHFTVLVGSWGLQLMYLPVLLAGTAVVLGGSRGGA